MSATPTISDYRQTFLSRLAEIETARDEALNAAHCSHDIKEVVRRTIRGGAVQYVAQCTSCGEQVGGAISRRALPVPESQISEFKTERTNSAAEVFRNFEKEKSAAFWSLYSEYLDSWEWKKKRQLVLDRAHGICEGCGRHNASQVHHLTYRHVFDELLFELVAVCDTCHERAHDDHDEALR